MLKILLGLLRFALAASVAVGIILWAGIGSDAPVVRGAIAAFQLENTTPEPTSTFTPTPTFTPTSTSTPTSTPTSTFTATPTSTPTYTPTPTPTPHSKKDPRKDPWPALTAAELKSIQDLIDQGKKQEALDKLVEILKRYCCNFDTMAGGKPLYDPKLEGEGAAERKKGGAVRIGDAAFRDATWLYSSLKHEMVHSQQWQDEEAAKKLGSNGREREAYQRELDNAANTGIREGDKKEIQERLKTY